MGTCAFVLALTLPATAQTFDSQSKLPPAHQDTPRRARTLRPDRSDWANQPKHEYADSSEATTFGEGDVDVAVLEARIRDLSAKVRELNDLLQRQKETTDSVRFRPRPMRATLLERHRPVPIPQTYGEALAGVVRDRARHLRATFGDDEERARLAFDPEPAEVRRLLEPIDLWLAAPGTPEERMCAHLRALVYATLLEARAGIEAPEPLPVVHKMLRDLHVDRGALTEHLRSSFLLESPTKERDLAAVLALTATAYREPPAMRDFLSWLAEGVGADLKDELLRQAKYPYRADPAGQFDAAADNAVDDNRDVIKLQVELQRMLVEVKALRATQGADEHTTGAWQHRLLQAERELDRLLRAADSEREAVMTLARRVPVELRTKAPVPAPESFPPASLSIEPAEQLASDDLTTQH